MGETRCIMVIVKMVNSFIFIFLFYFISFAKKKKGQTNRKNVCRDTATAVDNYSESRY